MGPTRVYDSVARAGVELKVVENGVGEWLGRRPRMLPFASYGNSR